MATIHYLGTCSGTEPMVGMHQCSWILETGGAFYWFDAGEGCGYTAYTSGLDIMKTRALFVSHPHIDHTGGLSHLLFCMDKMASYYKKTLVHDNTLEIFFPDLPVLSAIRTVACGGGLGTQMRFDICEHGIADGLLYEDENLRVTALHNRHLKCDDNSDRMRSFSFLLETEGRRIVYSGDVREPRELDALIGEGVDLLIMETGHHKVADVCEYARIHNVKNLRFHHHGREIIDGRERAEAFAAAYGAEHGFSIRLCYDGMTETI